MEKGNLPIKILKPPPFGLTNDPNNRSLNYDESTVRAKAPVLCEKEIAIDVMYILIYFCDENASIERWGDVM